MTKPTIFPPCDSVIHPDHDIQKIAQMAFLEEVQSCGGSLIATSHAYRITSAEIARRACILELLSFWQSSDFDCEGQSDRNLPSYIALEDCIFALEEQFGMLDAETDFGRLRVGINRLRREEIWTRENLSDFLKSGESLFGGCRDHLGTTSVYAAYGLDALDRTSCRILQDNPELRAELHHHADIRMETYFDHLSEDDIERANFSVAAISRGERAYPAWVCGKILAMGLSRISSPALDPVLDPEVRAQSTSLLKLSPLAIARQYHKALDTAAMIKASMSQDARHAVRLRLAAAAAGLGQISERTATPRKIRTILEHLDDGAKRAGKAGKQLHAISFACHTSLISRERHS